jgi:hypothetical protein
LPVTKAVARKCGKRLAFPGFLNSQSLAARQGRFQRAFFAALANFDLKNWAFCDFCNAKCVFLRRFSGLAQPVECLKAKKNKDLGQRPRRQPAKRRIRFVAKFLGCVPRH